MENIENLVTDTEEVVTENVEQTTEETPKMYTEKELNARVNDIVGKRVARKEAKLKKEYEAKFGDLTNVLRAGTGKESIEDITETFSQHYEKRGIEIPKKPTYTSEDIAVLATVEAEEIIGEGYEEVVEETDRLASKGLDKMTAREKAVFKRLAEHRKTAEETRELSKIGVTEEEYASGEFKDFAKQFNPSTPITKVYEIYRQTKPKKEITTMGSMKSSTVKDTGVKDFYSRDEALKFTKKDFDENPALFKKVQESMTKW